MKKKINIFLNGVYVCSSFKYRTCTEAQNALKKAGCIKWAGANPAKLEEITLTKADIIKAHFERARG